MSEFDWLRRNIDDQLVGCTTVQVPEEIIRRMMKVVEAANLYCVADSQREYSNALTVLARAVAALQASRPGGEG